MADKPSPMTIAVRVCFVLYTMTLLTATHWPKLTVHGPIERTDLVVHLGAFGLWTLLLGLTGWVTSSRSILWKTLWLALIGIAYGWFDELTQPLFSRVFDVTDGIADMSGVILASLVLMFYWYHQNGRSLRIVADSMDQPATDARS